VRTQRDAFSEVNVDRSPRSPRTAQAGRVLFLISLRKERKDIIWGLTWLEERRYKKKVGKQMAKQE
jgi:hypothetical protein